VGKLVAFCPGAAYGPAKQWFPERFKALAETLGGEGHRILVLGAEADRELGDFILEKLPPGRKLNLAGATGIRELMATLAVCDGLVTNDSGPLHLADALGTPAVALFGSTDSTWTGPQGKQHAILQAEVACNPCFLRECPLNMECMRSLSVESAELAVHRILA
jgi:heptosyltransferase-2